MIRFNNDYNHGAHPAIIKALAETNDTGYAGYGTDTWCQKAEDVIRQLCQKEELHVHFFPGATQANFIVCASILSPIDSVVCADTGHINAHECASVESTGHKILTIPNHDGKIDAGELESFVASYYEQGEPEYLTIPRMVYISQATELGTIYSLEELKAISAVCRKYGMMLFVDGARLGYAMSAANADFSLADLASLCDVFYIGGTKCGALMGEAVVICNPALENHFKHYMKQNGAVLAKGWLLGLQFYVLLKDGLYMDITRKADEYAIELKKAFKAHGIPLHVDSPTNQQFVLLTEEQMKKLAPSYVFEDEGKADETHHVVRFCTSWSTTKEDIDALKADIKKL
jgi:threonine aldolase